MSARNLRCLAIALAVLNDATTRLLKGDTSARDLADKARKIVLGLTGGKA